MRPGLPAWHNLVSQNEIWVQVSEYDKSSWSYETRGAPIPTSKFEIRYHSLQNCLINCCNVSLHLIVFEQYFVYHLFTIFAKQSGILCSVYASSCDFQKERYA